MFESLVLERQERTSLRAPLTGNHKQRPGELFHLPQGGSLPLEKAGKTKDSEERSGNRVDGVLRKSQK